VKTIKMQGGLGNQLFCLAFAHSVARLGGEPLAIDLAAFGADRYGHAFELREQALALADVRFVHRGLLGARLTTALMRAASLPGYVSEREPPANKAALAALIGRGRYFNGYWQHEAYIADPEAFVARTREGVLRRAGPTPRRDLVIHYRTYKEEIRAAARHTPGPDYVRAALARIEASLGRPAEVCLVSDDPARALEKLGDIGRDITVVAGAGPWDDMALLMRARALILTNSSFSWWGGFCGEAEAVIYPRANGYFHYPIPAARFACV
jgi:hypothetical protein